jgi:ribosomal protein S18 acetylase RimI-like enzyme
MKIRPYAPDDLESLREICLRTGANGGDAGATCTHRDLLGDYYAVPYVIRDPSMCLMLADESGPCGYILGTEDTQSFNKWFNEIWLPEIRAKYQNLTPSPKASDGWLLARLDEDPPEPDWINNFPAHLHIDLLPRAQGGGWGRLLFESWVNLAFSRGATGIHLGVYKANTKAVGFYEKMGMSKIADANSTWIMGLTRLRPLSRNT